MDFEEFSWIVTNQLNLYFEEMWYGLRTGRLESPSGVVMFPAYILAREHTHHFSFELIGSQKGFEERLYLKKIRSDNVNLIFDLFARNSFNSGLILDGDGPFSFSGVCLAHPYQIKLLESRFPFLALYEGVIKFPNAKGRFIHIGANCRGADFQHCVIVNKTRDIYRCKHILALSIHRKDWLEYELINFLREKFYKRNPIQFIGFGTATIPRQSEDRYYTASLLQNMYISSDIRENMIGEYLRDHPEIFSSVFDAEKIFHETNLSWIVSEYPMDEKRIRPDFIIKRRNGDFCVLDLKLAKPDTERLYRGRTGRRRYFDYVWEGVVQLKNYRSYFKHEANASHVFEKIGEKIKDPKAILVVGNEENLPEMELFRLRELHSDVDILTYDTLVSEFLRPGETG